MKKILITLRDITETGGGERVCANLSNALSEFYEIKIISFFKKENHITYDLDSRISVEYLSDGPQNSHNFIKKFYNKIFKRIFLSLRTSRIIKKQNPDIVFCNDGTFMPLVKPKNVKFIRLWHLNAPKKKKKVFDRYDSLVVLSSRQIDLWNQYHRNIRIIPNFLPEITEKLTDYSQKTIVSVGRMDNGDQKGFIRLVDIWEKVLEDKSLADWKLHIVGNGILKQEIEAKAKYLNLQDSIIIKPFSDNIAEEYLQASIYAMASRFEGFGMVLAESAAFGLPGVAFDINAGPSDIISDNESGFLIEDGNINAFAKKLQSLMHDESMRQRFGKKAKEIASQKFSKEAVVGKWIKLFDELLSRQSN
ncbi:MAG: glycosyltransferase family 4 protein [Bacteroidales bacterium]|nr:glycosyltransferase family 4 protein [Bacteroidales bacterium]